MSIAAVPLHPFYLRSQNALGCIYLHVSERRISEICLFPDKASFEVYPLDVQKLVNKGVAFQLSEITTAVFEDALNQFFERFANATGGSNRVHDKLHFSKKGVI